MLRNAFLSAAVLLAASHLVFAQATATINGRVADQSGAALPGVTVTVTNVGTGVARDTVTNAEGLYSVPALTPGSYNVQAALTGFAPSGRRAVELLTGAILTVDLQLGLATLEEAVTVTGQVPLVETTQSAASSSIRQTEVAQLPMLNRSLAAMITLLPGAREVAVAPGSPHGQAASYVSFGGGTGRNFTMLVDGVENHDDHDGGTAMTYSLEGVQEFRTLTSSFAAEYGKEATAVVLATKSGTNDVRGSVFAYGRNQALTATDYFSQPENGGQGKQPFSRAQYGGSLGGPLLKDFAWYFGSLERVQQEFTLPRPDNLYQQLLYLQPLNIGAADSHAIAQPFRDLLTQAKTNLQLRQHHSLFVRFASQVGYTDNDFVTTGRALLACCAVAERNDETMWDASMGWTWVASPTTVNQFTAQYLYYHHDNQYPPCDPATCLLQRLNFPSVSTGVQQSFPHWHNFEEKVEFKDDLSRQAGRHALKIGIDYEKLPLFGGTNGYSSPGGITFFDDPSVIANNANGRYPLGFQTPGIVRSITVTPGTAPSFDVLGAWSLGAYFQDDFKVLPKLTLNLGVRYDVYEFMDQPQLDQNRIHQVLQTIGSPYGQLPKTDTTNVAPRLGLAWDIRGDGKDIVRAAYGIFYGTGTMNTYILPTILAKKNIYFTETFIDPAIGTGPLANFVYGVTPLPTAPLAPTQLPNGQSVSSTWYDPTLTNPLSEDTHVGFSHLFPHETVLSLDYTHILGLRGWRNLDINPLLKGVRPLGAQTLAAYGDPNLLGPTTIVSSVDRSLYDELAVHFERRFSQTAAVQANYTLAWARGMGGVTDGTSGGNGALPPQTPSAAGGDIYAPWEWGPTAFDERHRITIAGVFNLPFAIDVSPSFTAASARPYPQYRALNPSGDGNLQVLCPSGNSDDLGFGVGQLPCGVNNARGLALLNANARVTKNLALPSAKKLALFVEFYNLFNRANFGNNYNSNAFAPATYNKPNGYLGGIAAISTVPISFQVQFGGRVSF
jgi:hypothetical protein